MKGKKIILFFTSVVVAVITAIGFAGCKQGDPKYDVAIKVSNNYGMEWVFEPGVDELYYEFEYTGEDMTFGVDDYYVYGDPIGGDRWLDCSGMAINWFGASSPLYTSPTGEQYDTEIIREKGNYSIFFYTNRSEWNKRSIILYVTVK